MSSVNAVIITYNQQDYIEKAIEGAVQQKFGGEYKIIIHDDCSTDRTFQICNAYKNKYPSLIDLYKAPGNKGMARSWADALGISHSKYIAICEGDDYWTDPNKLQMQVDFLEANPGYSTCSHRVYKQKDDKRPKLDSEDMYAPSIEASYDIEMMAREGNLIATPSVVYRNGLFSSFPGWFDQTPIADYVLHMLNAQYGKIKYFPNTMAVYREHAQGAWGGRSRKENALRMTKVISLLLTEPFKETVKEGLRDQLLKNKAIYLYDLKQENPLIFDKELNTMSENDKAIVLTLTEKMEKDNVRRSVAYKVLGKLRNIFNYSKPDKNE